MTFNKRALHKDNSIFKKSIQKILEITFLKNTLAQLEYDLKILDNIF